ncbi:MAG: purine-binding chemotaxis protein CheW [Candidatus Hydrogenedentes bacterium]|nr:purine-binding chemotaxis protein CheW [Candidatus Hydrogenedentota bacterium]
MASALAEAPVMGGVRAATLDRAGQYLTFSLGPEVYGLEILKVQEIIGMMPVTKVPRTPNFVRGVVNLRGKVIPVIDLRTKFEMDLREDTEKTCIIVVQVASAAQNITMGIIVDEVAEVLAIAGDLIEPAPQFGAGVRTEFILGIGKVANKVVILLDVDKVLSWGEMAELEDAAQA